MKRFFLILIMVLALSYAKGQYHDAKWVLCDGYNNFWNNVILDFNNSQAPQVQIASTYVPMLGENTSVSDSVGNLLFFTNGTRLFDRNLNFMPGGILIPPLDTNGMYSGLAQRQGCMFLPWPDDTNKYVLLHTTKELALPQTYPGFIPYHLPRHLYMTVLDKSMNGGLGGIVNINQIIVLDTLTNWGGGLSVTKHANGRDWWILVKKHYKNKFYKFLLTPSGIQSMGFQLIGLDNQARHLDYYSFSPNGSVLAGNIAFSAYAHDIVLFNFDRCTGVLSNHQIIFNPNNPNHGCEDLDFSPNSRYLYATERVKIFQYDLQNINIAGAVQSTRVVVADTAFSSVTCDPPSTTTVKIQYPLGALAADGRIYYPPSFSCQKLSYFNSPDSAGLLSDFVYGGLNITNLHATSLPYFPNYRLGPVVGSVCDTLSVGLNELQASNVLLYPNPAKSDLTISLGRVCNTINLRMYSLQGQLLLTQHWNVGNALTLALPQLSKGLYMVEIICDEGVVVKKVVVE